MYQQGVLELVLDAQASDTCATCLPWFTCDAHLRSSIAVKIILDEPEDKVLPRLGITYGVLRRLGFGEERVLECLRSIHGVELDEAFEWVCSFKSHSNNTPKLTQMVQLYLRCSEDELMYDKRELLLP